MVQASAINPRLIERLAKWRAYNGNMRMAQWVRHTKSQAWGHGNTGFTAASRSWGSTHGNRLRARGPHDVYALFDRRTGRLLRFWETGRGYLTRLREWQARFLEEHGIPVIARLISTVEGKAAARHLETRLIRRYERAYGALPPFQRTYH